MPQSVSVPVPAVPRAQGPVEGCAKGSEDQTSLKRFVDSYTSHLAWNGIDPNAPTTNVLGGSEVPESSPPWPYSTWGIGGTPAIGVDNLYSSVLTDALYCGKDGQSVPVGVGMPTIKLDRMTVGGTGS